MSNYVKVFDTTLRDGEQSPGATLTSAEKLKIARSLARLGVDIMEAGFPAASPDDLEAVRQIAIEVGNTVPEGRTEPPTIAGLARAKKGDIDAAWEAVQHAKNPRIHTFLATSPIHMQHKLRMDPEEVVEQVRQMVTYARSLCADIEFSPEDAGRSDPDFLCLVLGEAIKAGATTLNIPDTVGYQTPEGFGNLIKYLKENTPGADKVTFSVHCHNDLGMATANTLAGVENGARQVEVTINGIGERAGNTSLEEVVMALKTRSDFYGLETGIDATQIMPLSRQVSRFTGMTIQANKAIVGQNAFAHEAGIHQDGMLKNQETYEIMRPEDVGLSKSELVLGKHSGRHAFKVRMQELGYTLEGDLLHNAFRKFKDVADRKKVVTDADLIALVDDQIMKPTRLYRVAALQVTCGTIAMPTASVRVLDPDGETHTAVAIGTGPVDAAFKAIDQIIQMPNSLEDYSVRSVSDGIDAIGEVSVRLEAVNGSMGQRQSPQSGITYSRTYGGHGAETDIVLASVKAYVSALNKMVAARDRAMRDES